MTFDEMFSGEPEKVLAFCAAEVKRPGKFEGAAIFAPYYYAAVLDGHGDYTIVDDDAGETITDVFRIEASERELFQLAPEHKLVAVYTSHDGFVVARLFATEHEIEVWAGVAS